MGYQKYPANPFFYDQLAIHGLFESIVVVKKQSVMEMFFSTTTYAATLYCETL